MDMKLECAIQRNNNNYNLIRLIAALMVIHGHSFIPTKIDLSKLDMTTILGDRCLNNDIELAPAPLNQTSPHGRHSNRQPYP